MEVLKTSVPAIDKMVRICTYLRQVGHASFSRIQTSLSLPKSSTHTILESLLAHGLIHVDENGSYSLGLKLYEFGSNAIASFDFKREAMPILYDLRDKARLTCHLGVLQEREAIYLVKVESPQSVIVKSWEGRRLALHCTSLGKALIAWKSEVEIDHIFPQESLPSFTPKTITTRTELKRDLEIVRQRGWAIDDGEDKEGVRCISAPVRDAAGSVIAAISVSGVDFQIPDSRIEELSILVKAACIAMSGALAFRP